MMRRCILLLALGFAVTAPVSAGKLGRDVRGSWLGAWVVTGVESYSDCSSGYTHNRVNGELVRGKGQRRFQPGELAKLDRIDIQRKRVDLRLSLAEPMLVEHQEGPFTLYREVSCRIELEIVVPREFVKEKDASAIDQMLAGILERYPTEEAARDSSSWNLRERGDYPDDYEVTLARLEVWRAEQHNSQLQQQLDIAHTETARLADRIRSDENYLAGFAEGVQTAGKRDLRSCMTLMSVDLEALLREDKRSKPDPLAQQRTRGSRDGQLLVYSLALLRDGSECFVPVPEVYEADE